MLPRRLRFLMILIGIHAVGIHGGGDMHLPLEGLSNKAVGEEQGPAQGDRPTGADTLWGESIRPLLEANCFGCHGERKRTNGLDTRRLASLGRGGESGPAIVPGNPLESLLFQVVQPGADPHMPPGDKQLTDAQIRRLSDWIAILTEDDIARSARDERVADESASERDDDDDDDDNNKDEPGSATSNSEADDDATWTLPSGVSAVTVIDLLVEAGWNRAGVTPSGPCDDRTFARRVYLDLLGRIPTTGELEDFLASTDSDKRAGLVDDLLSRPQWAVRMAEVFDVALMGRGRNRDAARRRENGWLDYLETCFRENRPWNRVVEQILLARPVVDSERGATWFLYERGDKHQEIAEAIAPAFFGVQIQCAQCHDHPLAEEIEQRHYWGLVAFYNRGKNTRSKLGPSVAESAVGGFSQFADLSGQSQDNLLVFLDSDVVPEPRPEEGEKQEDKDEYYVAPVGADGSPIDAAPRVPRFSRRGKFVEEVVRDNPRIARAMVNRVWALLMGRGLVHPVDQMDSAHPPSHPRLLDWLAADFRRTGYDVKRLVRAVALSRPYRLSSEVSDAAVAPSTFSFALQKPLIAESYLRSVMVALGRPVEGVDQDMGDLLEPMRETFPDVFPEQSVTTLQQTLFLSNHPGFQGVTREKGEALFEELAELPDDERRAERIFVAFLGRVPDADEARRVTEYLRTQPDPETAVSRLAWALMTSAEFRFNH